MDTDSGTAPPSRARVWAVTGASLLAAALAEVFHLPAGALLGGMLVALVGTVGFSARISLPASLQLGSSALLGAALCSAFPASAWSALAAHWGVALINVVGVVVVAQLVALVFSRLSGLEVRTTTLGLMPGGAPAMIALSEEMGADSRLVTLFQYVRLIVVIIVAGVVGRWAGDVPNTQVATAAALPGSPSPLLAWGVTILVVVVGGWLGLRFKLPAGVFLGPMLLGVPLTALDIPVGALPPGLLPLAMWGLGVRVGSQFDVAAVRELRRHALAAVGAAVALVGGCVMLAWAWATVGGVDLLTTYFATSPGGADSVLAIALGTHASLSLVLSVQIGRLLLILFLIPGLLRRFARRR
ncbi:AbrB family transcriptional regulator [Hyalangium rubrum]|uniref:AbrB family transcriptional regulator n=1 Tax=Hyalangium rubrum TaxID=3103134 RepID=A0ABU5H3E3_9BACT|nr:AbrB family transcriptional regulator [Hyalangium sp. s54d21]MDY7227307.1 AbrB family transcriptional regulator [Hyalangium sp. s54d21]